MSIILQCASVNTCVCTVSQAVRMCEEERIQKGKKLAQRYQATLSVAILLAEKWWDGDETRRLANLSPHQALCALV